MINGGPAGQRVREVTPGAAESATGVEKVLDLLLAERGLDFHLYRQSTIERRLSHRMTAVQAPDYEAYLAFLRERPAELDQLIANLTLKVTGFFRNPGVFALLKEVVLRPLLAEQAEISIWSAGCATGEEPYSLAILLEELLEGGERRPPFTIIGSDIDEAALRAACAARYAASALGEQLADIAPRWFSTEEGRRGPTYTLGRQVRQGVEFVWHNLADATEPPAGGGWDGFDLVLCRNVLIYFQRPLQATVIELLHRSVRAGGCLVLGEAESLPVDMERQYQCLDRRARIFRKMSP